MHPTLLSVGRWNISTYTVLIDLGLLLGLLLTVLEGKRCFGRGEIGFDLGIWAMIGGIIGGRLAIVIANWSAFSEDWSRALRIREGGLSFHGAFMGGLIVMAIVAWLWRRNPVPGQSPPRIKAPAHESEHGPARERTANNHDTAGLAGFLRSFFRLGDMVTPGLALGVAFGWAACVMIGCAYGILGAGLGYAILPDLYGVFAPRFAVQAVGLAFALLLAVAFLFLRRRWPFPGAPFLMYVLLYFAGMFFLEFARADEAIYAGPWRITQLVDLVLALAAAAGLLVLWWQAWPGGQEDAEAGPAADAVNGSLLGGDFV